MALHYNDDDMSTLKKMYLEHYSLEAIAACVGRSLGSVAQRVRRSGLKRSQRTDRLVQIHGRWVLKFGTDPDLIRAGLDAKHSAIRDAKRREKANRQIAAIERLQKDLKTSMARNFAIKRAYAAGATLQQIGMFTNMTKQGVSLIVNPERTPYANQRRDNCRPAKVAAG